jgi:hypothetical protein
VPFATVLKTHGPWGGRALWSNRLVLITSRMMREPMRHAHSTPAQRSIHGTGMDRDGTRQDYPGLRSMCARHLSHVTSCGLPVVLTSYPSPQIGNPSSSRKCILKIR